MILADKIIALRKKYGWTQEDLAEKVGVSRQSVSKWEGAQSVPDLEKILQLANLFGVSTDYLLKDSMEEMEYVKDEEYVDTADAEKMMRRVSMEEANEFLRVKELTSKRIALGVSMCICSPVCLLILGAASELKLWNVSESLAGGVGLLILLIMIALAVALFIFCGSMTGSFSFLETEDFETEYGVTGMVRERRNRFKDTYTMNNVIGVSLCILAAIPLFAGGCWAEANPKTEDFVMACMVSVVLVMVAVGVFFLVHGGIRWESMQKLLQEGDYTKKQKRKRKRSYGKVIGPVYWPVVTAIYLICLFLITPDEYNDYSWVIWPVAGVLYAAIVNLADGLRERNKEEN